MIVDTIAGPSNEPDVESESSSEKTGIGVFVGFLGAGIVGFTACLLMGADASGTLGWTTAAQVCYVLAMWPRINCEFNYAVQPAVLLLLSVPLYVASVMWGGSSGMETGLSLVLVYLIFLYVSLLMKLEDARGIPAAAWYVPVSVLFVGGPILIYYVLAEFLKRPMPWIAGISPMMALSDSRLLSVGCGAWVGVIAVLGLAVTVFGRTETKE